MATVLITGMSGTGKSAALAELERRGHRVVDTDYDDWIEDVRLPDGSGVDACREILATHPHIRVIFLTSYADDDSVLAAVLAVQRQHVIAHALDSRGRREPIVSPVEAQVRPRHDQLPAARLGLLASALLGRAHPDLLSPRAR